MNFSKLIITYISMLILFLLLDSIWLGLIAKDLYKNNIGHLMGGKVIWGAAIIFYLLFIVGILIFAVLPSIETTSVLKTLLLGALFGLITYATYDLTNQATLKDWPLKITIIDMLWGSTISMLVSYIGFTIIQKLN